MTYQANCTLPESLLEQIAEQGLGVLPELVRIVINKAMPAERENYLGGWHTSGQTRKADTPTATNRDVRTTN